MRATLTHRVPHTTSRAPSPPTAAAKRIHPALLTVSLALAAGIFLFDLFIPQGIGVPALYMAPVVLVELWSSSKESNVVVLFAILCSLLTMAGFFLAPDSSLPLWVSIPNRLIALFIIWVTVVLSLMRKSGEEEVKTLRGLLPICSYCKKIRDDQGYWKSLEVYIATHSQADFTHGLCPECGMKHYPDVFAR
jgi:hypothetical protein